MSTLEDRGIVTEFYFRGAELKSWKFRRILRAMISGSTRYARSLGFMGGLGETVAESTRNSLEKWSGIDATGSLKTSGGSGWTIGAAPSTILAMIFGAGITAAIQVEAGGSAIGGAFKGAIAGLIISGGLRTATNVGI